MPLLSLFGGLAILCGLLLLAYLFVNADPARLAQRLKWIGIAVGAAALLALAVVTEGRALFFLAPLIPLVPALRRIRTMFTGARGRRNCPTDTRGASPADEAAPPRSWRHRLSCDKDQPGPGRPAEPVGNRRPLSLFVQGCRNTLAGHNRRL